MEFSMVAWMESMRERSMAESMVKHSGIKAAATSDRMMVAWMESYWDMS